MHEQQYKNELTPSRIEYKIFFEDIMLLYF